jgi:hypothetical protein
MPNMTERWKLQVNAAAGQSDDFDEADAPPPDLPALSIRDRVKEADKLAVLLVRHYAILRRLMVCDNPVAVIKMADMVKGEGTELLFDTGEWKNGDVASIPAVQDAMRTATSIVCGLAINCNMAVVKDCVDRLNRNGLFEVCPAVIEAIDDHSNGNLSPDSLPHVRRLVRERSHE